MINSTKISREVKRLQLKHTWTIARGSSDYRDNVFVTLKKNGVVGYGEAAPIPRYAQTDATAMAAIERLTDLVERSDLFEYRTVINKLREMEPLQNAARAALEIALMDWLSKSYRVPYHRFLGLDGSQLPATSFSIGIDSPEMIRSKVDEAKEFPYLKVKLGLENDEEIIDSVRSATNKPVRVDANEGWKDKEAAIRKIDWLQKRGIELVEQPMPSRMLEETAWLRERSGIPLIADESVMNAADIPKLAQAFDGINIKLMKSGGLQAALEMITVARAHGMKVMLGCMVESSVAISAAACIAPLVDYVDLDGNLLLRDDPFVGVQVKRGALVLSDAHGIGVEPNKT